MSNKFDNNVNARRVALDILVEVFENKELFSEVHRSTLNKYQYIDKKQRSYISKVTRGVFERYIEIDTIINAYSKTPIRKMNPSVRNILRLGVYEIRYMDSIPESASCNECVKLVGKKAPSHLKGFVNGILRSVVRNDKDIVFKNMWQELSIPEWMWQMFVKDYGEESAKAFCKCFQESKPISIRTNLNLCTPEGVVKCLEEDNVKVSSVNIKGLNKANTLNKSTKDVAENKASNDTNTFDINDYAYYIEDYDYLERLKAFQDGLFYVQDISSMMVAQIAEPKAGDKVLDVCAAPGGKALHFAELIKVAEGDGPNNCGNDTYNDVDTKGDNKNDTNNGHVEARDLTDYKVSLIEENIARTALDNITAKKWDARVFDESLTEKMDIVVCDLPCSGLGIIGKKPDIKLNISKEDITELATLQREILTNAKRYVKSGGKMIFSTCTINRQENDENVEWFLSENKEFELVYEKQFYPSKKYDGFFIALFQRRN